MNAQERQMLQGVVDRVSQTPLATKDPDAEQMIQQTLGQNPDALYVLAQTVLVQGYALQQAQRQVADLRAQLEQAQTRAQAPKHGGSFLGSLLGRNDDAQPRAAAPPPPPQYPGAGYGPGLAYPSGGYPIAGAPAAGGGFLQSALQTATGVAAGALAFEGIESLMHGFGHPSGYTSSFVGEGGRPEEIINNYYADGSSREHEGSRNDVSGHDDDSSPLSNASNLQGEGRLQDASYIADQHGESTTNADDLSGTADTDYSSQGDDSMLSDNVGSDADGNFAADAGSDFGTGDSSSF